MFLLNIDGYSRIPICGMILQYNLDKPEGVHNVAMTISKRVKMHGFLAFDYYHLCPKFLEMALTQIKEGKIIYTEGFENSPAALVVLFSGRNVKKQVVVISRYYISRGNPGYVRSSGDGK